MGKRKFVHQQFRVDDRRKEMNNKRFVASIVEIVMGSILIACSFYGIVDEYWNGMGVALLVVGVIFFIRQFKYKTNEDYREKFDVERSDERNRYISGKAWAWAGYLFVMIAAAASIMLKLVGREELMLMASGSVCLIIALYWISYMILKRKY